ncbi:MAG: riboflavin biosynthesis pyrimidine reductase [Candidatus Poriferisodalaceae bacterium]
MHRLLPPPIIEMDLDEAYRDNRHPVGARPWVMMNMITTFDGAIELDGTSGGLGSPGDKDVFSAIRAIPDVILAGSSTVTAERYNPPSTSVSTRVRRMSHGAWPTARIAVVSGSLSFDMSIPMFAEASKEQRPLVITTEDPPAERLLEVAQVADVIRAGVGQVDMALALKKLGGLGARVVLCEGGPTMNGQLLADDLVDEVCMSLAPLAGAGDSRRMAMGPAPEAPTEFDLRQVLVEDHYLFLRYVRDGVGA